MEFESSPNADFISTWNEILVPKFLRFRAVLVNGFTKHSDTALEKHIPASGERVLDVGAGFGDTTIQIARRVGTRGSVLGVDCCEAFLELGRQDAERAGLENVRFQLLDAQTARFEPSFERVFSRFGTMFFQGPRAAFTNLRHALVPGGQLTMIVWRSLQENGWVKVPKEIVAARLPPPPEDGRTCGPGPFSLADPETVESLLTSAGFEDVTFEPIDVPVTVGATPEEAVDFQLQLGPAGELMREAGELATSQRAIIEAELLSALASYAGPGGVVMSSASWCVSARNPS